MKRAINLKRVLLALFFPILVILGVVASRLDLFGYLPPCKLRQWTGLHCPGCGGTRAFQSMANADLLGALRMNPVGVVLIAAVALLVLRTSWEAMFPECRWPRLAINDRWAWWLVAGIGAFFVLRNLPWWPFTLLAPA